MVERTNRIFTKRFDRLVRRSVAFLGGLAALAVSFTLYAVWPSNQAIGYEPEQPFVFNHKVMAGDAQIPCLYCHSGAETGPHAGVPPVSLCMNCHSEIRPKDANGQLKPDFVAFLQYIDPATNQPKRPIHWQKVHDLSDFAYFDHSRHVIGARLDCSECHGPVETMTRIRRVHPFTMGWCIDCHQKPPEPWRTDGRATRGPTACSTCHR
jgi:hypothetical protein